MKQCLLASVWLLLQQIVGIKPSYWLQVHSLVQVYQKQLLHKDGQAYLSAKHMQIFKQLRAIKAWDLIFT